MDSLRDLLRAVEREGRHQDTSDRLQQEAAARPESALVQTPAGQIWMSPIESKLYAALRAEGLSPIPQFCVQGYFVDFAFPDICLAVEADGAAYHSGPALERDRKRDWILQNAGWTVKRFHGATIYNRAPNCAFVVKREVETTRAQILAFAEAEARRRTARREALLAPFRKLIAHFRPRPPVEPAPSTAMPPPPTAPLPPPPPLTPPP